MVSIVIPTYNRAELLGGAIKSVLEQTYQDFEVLIIDDCSTDSTAEVIASFNDKRIKYTKLLQNSGGSALPRNIGLEIAQGNYIAILDDDSFWVDKDKLLLQVQFLDTHPSYILVGTNAVGVNKNNQILVRIQLPQTDEEVRSKLLSKNCFWHSSIMFRRRLVTSTGGYTGWGTGYYTQYSNDYGLWLKLGLLGKFANLPIYGAGYTITKDNTGIKNRLLQGIRSLRLAKQYKTCYPNYWLAVLSYFPAFLYIFLHILSDLPFISRLKRHLRST